MLQPPLTLLQYDIALLLVVAVFACLWLQARQRAARLHGGRLNPTRPSTLAWFGFTCWIAGIGITGYMTYVFAYHMTQLNLALMLGTALVFALLLELQIITGESTPARSPNEADGWRPLPKFYTYHGRPGLVRIQRSIAGTGMVFVGLFSLMLYRILVN